MLMRQYAERRIQELKGSQALEKAGGSLYFPFICR